MKLFTQLLTPSLFILTAYATPPLLEPRQATTNTPVFSTVPLPSVIPPPVSTATTPTPTLIDIKPTEYPSWTTSLNPFQTAKPVQGPSQDEALKQVNLISQFRPDAQQLSAQQVLNILKKVSQTSYCSLATWGKNANTEALIHFAGKACVDTFPVGDAAYWISQNAYIYHAYCGPPTKDQFNNTIRTCLNYNIYPVYVQNANNNWVFMTQSLCAAAFKKAINFCAKDIFGGRFINSVTEISLGATFSLGVYDNFQSDPPPRQRRGIEEQTVKRDIHEREVLRKRGGLREWTRM